MRIAAHYSHLNGLEYLLVHQPGIWEEIQEIIAAYLWPKAYESASALDRGHV